MKRLMIHSRSSKLMDIMEGVDGYKDCNLEQMASTRDEERVSACFRRDLPRIQRDTELKGLAGWQGRAE